MTTRISMEKDDKKNIHSRINIPKIDFENKDDQIVQFFNSNFMKSYERSESEDSNWDTITINNSSCSNRSRTIINNSTDNNNDSEIENKNTYCRYIKCFLFTSCCIYDDNA